MKKKKTPKRISQVIKYLNKKGFAYHIVKVGTERVHEYSNVREDVKEPVSYSN